MHLRGTGALLHAHVRPVGRHGARDGPRVRAPRHRPVVLHAALLPRAGGGAGGNGGGGAGCGAERGRVLGTGAYFGEFIFGGGRMVVGDGCAVLRRGIFIPPGMSG